MNLEYPKHVAIIMDGNGRWAKARGRERIFGHVKGARRARQIITYAAEQGIEHLTLFAFSTENWSRPADEVGFLMRLLLRYLQKERRTLIRNEIRFRCIGELARLPRAVFEEVQMTEAATRHLRGMNLTVALNYGGRQDITMAARKIAEQVEMGALSAAQVTDDLFGQFLQTHEFSDPDLIIRTSGELRLSNFMLWQSAYSEFYFTDTLWPDFRAKDFARALAEYAQRQRRFGGIGELPKETPNPAERRSAIQRTGRDVARMLSVLRPGPVR